MRLFVAVFPPEKVRSALAEACRLLPTEGKVRRVPPENIHLTLKFLGEVADERVPDLSAALEGVGRNHAPLDLTPSGFGTFPSSRRARVVWAGLRGDAAQLAALAKDVDAAFENLGFEREKRGFTPHLTLARAAGGRPVRLGSTEPSLKVRGFTVREITLAESVRSGGEVVYRSLARYPLAGEKSESKPAG